ncbi:MAG: MarR family transcriptional regulator [Oscillospiraceae bacterium]|nr:MarR family transcriptional regulator [Oscillospiraceae bacterium]
MADFARRYRDIDRAVSRLNRVCLYKLLQGEKIHPGQPPILKLLMEKDGRSQCELAKIIGVSRASLGVSLRRMEKAGLIVRTPDEKDSRYNTVCLTEEGRVMARRSDEALSTITAAKLRGFTPEETAQMLEFFDRIRQNLEELQEELK